MRIVLAAALALVCAPAMAQTVALKGPDGRIASVGAADLAALPRVSFVFDSHGTRHTFEGPLLADVLARIGAPRGTELRGAQLANVVLVRASDGYQVAFGLAEADPGTRPNRMILADRADGKPMGGEDGPFRLVVEGDLRPARSVRMVTAIEVVRLGSGEAPPPH